ncbi:hypothetical protein B9J78_06265 [bacterium Unc6]|nr:hypothetical protein [bacterium Unc6]
MGHQYFDRGALKIKPLSSRASRVVIERDCILPDTKPIPLSGEKYDILHQTVQRIKIARSKKKSVVLAFGAHTIKNGLGPVLIKLIEGGWITHLATNGAGIIHDWEFSYQGKSSEDVRKNIQKGQFGLWQETGFYINLAIVIGGYKNLGYGESVGKMIQEEGLDIPSLNELKHIIRTKIDDNPELVAAASDCYYTIKKFGIKSGFMNIPHPFKKFSVQAVSYKVNVPFTGHPMIGHDIIYCHPLNNGAAIGRTALRDFLRYASSINNIEDGVYLSLGSAVMSPMIFEKSFSMAQNISLKEGKHIQNHFILVVDLAQISSDWLRNKEPPPDDPAYYVRYCKTFSRMGGKMRYLSLDSKDFLLNLLHSLEAITKL